jgi:hypothetical protein
MGKILLKSISAFEILIIIIYKENDNKKYTRREY